MNCKVEQLYIMLIHEMISSFTHILQFIVTFCLQKPLYHTLAKKGAPFPNLKSVFISNISGQEYQ